jgi:hypothetical protein
LISAQNNTTKLESELIWNTITESLQGNAIQNKPQSYESVEFGILSQKDIIQILKDIFGAKKSKRHGEGRKLEFDEVKLKKLYPCPRITNYLPILHELDSYNFLSRRLFACNNVCTSSAS